MYILNIAKALTKISVNRIRAFIFEDYYKRIGFCKENSYYSMLLGNKLIEKVPDPRNYLSGKNFWKPKQCWCKISYYRTSYNQLSKTIRQAGKVDSNSSLYSDKKVKFFERKKCKNNKTRTCF